MCTTCFKIYAEYFVANAKVCGTIKKLGPLGPSNAHSMYCIDSDIKTTFSSTDNVAL